MHRQIIQPIRKHCRSASMQYQRICRATRTITSDLAFSALPSVCVGPCDLVIAPRNPNIDVIAANLQAFPNPNRGRFELRLDNFSSGKAEIRIMNIDGAIVERRSVNLSSGSQVLSFELKNKASGMYYVQVVTVDGIQNAKFMINR